MLKKIYNFTFVFLFWVLLSVPMIFANYTSGGISEDENRTLAKFPDVKIDGKFNENFTREFETWFMDHMGYRQEMITANAKIQYYGFERLLDKSDYYIGRNGDINYATYSMIVGYSHLNVRHESEVIRIGNSYQYVNDWLNEKGIQFYYVQCFDKHSIYPEQFMASVNQVGEDSKTDQMVKYLKNNTTLNVISMKDVLLDSKEKYEVYSNWGDPTHWTERGAFIGYQYVMEWINANNDNKFSVLQEDDYDIVISNQAITLNGFITQEDMLEGFTIKEPKAYVADNSVMGDFSSDIRHRVFKNDSVDNDTKVLLMCDSYFNSYIVEDFAESFSEVWIIWGDYTNDLDVIIDMYNPDIVVYECAERADRSELIYQFAQKLQTNITE